METGDCWKNHHTAQCSLDLTLEVDSVPLLKTMVMRGFGATVLTFAGVSLEIGRGELAACPIVRPSVVSTISVLAFRVKAGRRGS